MTKEETDEKAMARSADVKDGGRKCIAHIPSGPNFRECALMTVTDGQREMRGTKEKKRETISHEKDIGESKMERETHLKSQKAEKGEEKKMDQKK